MCLQRAVGRVASHWPEKPWCLIRSVIAASPQTNLRPVQYECTHINILEQALVVGWVGGCSVHVYLDCHMCMDGWMSQDGNEETMGSLVDVGGDNHQPLVDGGTKSWLLGFFEFCPEPCHSHCVCVLYVYRELCLCYWASLCHWSMCVRQWQGLILTNEHQV